MAALSARKFGSLLVAVSFLPISMVLLATIFNFLLTIEFSLLSVLIALSAKAFSVKLSYLH